MWGRIVKRMLQEAWRKEEQRGLHLQQVRQMMRMGNIAGTDQGCNAVWAGVGVASEVPHPHLPGLDPGISHWNDVCGQMTEAIQGSPAIVVCVVSTCLGTLLVWGPCCRPLVGVFTILPCSLVWVPFCCSQPRL